ncbi:MAG TPA: YlxR family protein [Pseudonocardiaceae bacterium]|nr:YlxR family protein [Pseudonocardiaceae bacterium]
MSTELLRTVVVDGVLVPDPRGRLAGRGAWLHPVPDCLRAAERRRAFPRALRVPGPLDVGEVRAYLAQQCSESQTAWERPGAGNTREAGRPVMSQP